MFIAIDPGSQKNGLALFSDSGQVQEKKVLDRAAVLAYVAGSRCDKIVMGLSVFGKALAEEILRYRAGLNIIYINERSSTLEARILFWRDNRPKNIWRIVPATLRPLPRPIDDYAAVVLGERYLKG